MSKASTKNTAAAQLAAAAAPPAAPPAPKEDPRFRSTLGRPIMLASLAGGHSVSITHEPEGTPLHSRFHRQAILEGALPLSSFSEVVGEDAALVAAAGRDRAAILRGCIADMVQTATEDVTQQDVLFTPDGRPRAEVMSNRIGFPVSIAERDAAWKDYAGDEDEDGDED